MADLKNLVVIGGVEGLGDEVGEGAKEVGITLLGFEEVVEVGRREL